MKSKHNILAAILTLIACLICIRIEVLNHQAGGPLPRSKKEIQGEWRPRIPTTENSWRKSQFRETLDNDYLTRELSGIERLAMSKAIEQNKRTNRLIYSLRSIGLLQYFVCPLAIVVAASATVRFRRKRLVMNLAAILAVDIVVYILMFFRAYYTSLGGI
jgi:hypothetical protein